jgi:spore maturation protein CgeB
MQGADERVLGQGNGYPAPALLFAGARGHGTQREEQFDYLIKRYGNNLRLIEGNARIYRRQLANAIASAKIVLAPESPVTDRYWSNRLYMVLGFGGFLLHPHSAGVAAQYQDGKEVVLYHSLSDLCDKICYYNAHPEERFAIAREGLAATTASHTYRHRCVELMRIVKERLQ